jgi:hypothetical protein
MAVIVAVPAATPVTRPLVDTDATVGALEVHVTGRPVSALPAESFGVAASWTVCPTARLAVAGATATDATGAIITVIAAVLAFPSLVAVIVAEPWVTAVTRPPALTVATLGLLLAHVTGRPVSGLLAESRGVAASCSVCPTNRFTDVGASCRDATGTLVTVTATVPL